MVKHSNIRKYIRIENRFSINIPLFDNGLSGELFVTWFKSILVILLKDKKVGALKIIVVFDFTCWWSMPL